MISLVSLVLELENFVEEVVKNYSLETKDKDGKRKAPQVLPGWLPPKDPEKKDDPDFPFVLVRFLDADDNEDQAEATIALIIGVYSKETTEAWQDVVSIMERIWLELFKKRIIGKRYQIQYPIKMSMPEE